MTYEELGSLKLVKLKYRRDEPVINGRVQDLPKIERGVVGLPHFYYFTVQFHLMCVFGESKIPFIKFWIFSILS